MVEFLYSRLRDIYSEFGLAPFAVVAIAGVAISLAFTVRAWRRRSEVPLLLGLGMFIALLFSLRYLPVSLAGLLGLVERSELLRDGAETLPFVALSLWYFYRKRSVVAYYKRLGRAA